MQKIKFLKSPFLIIAVICFVIAIFISFSVSNSNEKEIKGVSQKISSAITSTTSPTASPTYSYKQISNSPTVIPTAIQTNSNNQQNPIASPTPQQNTEQSNNTSIKTFQVSLKIDDSLAGNVDVPEGANQCDVLSRAKDQGKISSLLMKYDNNLGTNGVYQINGVGKENSIWWTYKVNGQSPSQGCSYVKANSGDSVEWKYVGS